MSRGSKLLDNVPLPHQTSLTKERMIHHRTLNPKYQTFLSVGVLCDCTVGLPTELVLHSLMANCSWLGASLSPMPISPQYLSSSLECQPS